MTKKEKAIEKINEEIKFAMECAEAFGQEYGGCYDTTMRKVDGMIEVLEILTGKKYEVTEDGIKEI